MGIKGKQSKRGEGEKEPDGSVRDAVLKIKIPQLKLSAIKQIASLRKISLTDLINKIISEFLGNHADNLTQTDDDKNEGQHH